MPAADTPRQLLEAFNRHDLATFASYFSEDATAEDPQYTEPLRGRDAIRQDMEDFLRAFPDMQAEIRSLVEQGDEVAIEMRMTGTQRGPLAGPSGEIPPTGRKVAMTIAIFDRLDAEGRIVEERRYYDLAGMLGQLGLMDAGGTPQQVPTPAV